MIDTINTFYTFRELADRQTDNAQTSKQAEYCIYINSLANLRIIPRDSSFPSIITRKFKLHFFVLLLHAFPIS